LCCCEITKAGSRRERREKNRRKKERRNKEEAWIDFRSLLYFSANKICRTGEKKVQESVERESDKDAEERKGKKQTQIQNRRKRFETNKHRPSNHHGFNIVVASSSPGLFLFTSCMYFFSLCLHYSSEL
jgi:hypothetical protein